jgi:hypothetical protein
MKIKVIDAFGAHVGDAEVTWKDFDYQRLDDFTTLQDEVNAIFPDPVFTVEMPTRNQHMSWRLEVTR